MIMVRLKEMLLMLCILLWAALCNANGNIVTQKKNDGHQVSIELTKSTGASSPDKSNTIISSINGHLLVVAFNENLGPVSVEVDTISGSSVECISLFTPNGFQVYIPCLGYYSITITLSNGDVYSGDFTVDD